MSKRVILLVEGQTEERFVKDVLSPYLWPQDIFVTATLLTTKKVKNGPNFKGGVTTFGKLKDDIRRVLRGAGDARVSTIIDYYGLPKDCPGLDSCPDTTPLNRVQYLEDALSEHIGDSRFKPFFSLHEYEAWLFTDAQTLPSIMLASPTQTDMFKAICAGFTTPEHIDGGHATAPSKRIVNLFPSYNKALHGPLAVARITIDRIRSSCVHFGVWLDALERWT